MSLYLLSSGYQVHTIRERSDLHVASAIETMADLRRSGTEAKRDHDHKAKWAYGARSRKAIRYQSEYDTDLSRPQVPFTHYKA